MADEHWLDDFSRTLASGMSRRAMLRRVGGSLVAVAVASVLPDVAKGAEPTSSGSAGGPGDGPAGTKPKTGSNVNAAAAPSSCPPGLTLCGNRCRNLQTDKKHCGDCVIECGPHSYCFDGGCSCNDGFCRQADGSCKRSANDPNNCGSCGNVCPSGPNATGKCRQGVCDGIKCNDGFRNCNGVISDGCETNINADPNNCGRCGRICDSDESCVQGSCTQTTCNDGLRNGEESDIDCGGSSCTRCANGKQCFAHTDCLSDLCDGATLTCRSCIGAKCPLGSCCNSSGVCVGFCPNGDCCNVTATNAVCIAADLCPNNGCCNGLGICVSGLDDTACGSDAVCLNCSQNPDGHVCLPDRRCGCNTEQDCPDGQACDPVLRLCGPCGSSAPCQSGCCERGTCVSACLIGLCCSNGECVVDCPGGQCCPAGGGACVATCPSGCCDGGHCQSSCSGNLTCVDHVCVECSANVPCPIGENCDNGVCVECSGDFPCPSGKCCNNRFCVESCPTGECCYGGLCAAGCSGRVCVNGVCVPCSDSVSCPSGQCCDDGVCVSEGTQQASGRSLVASSGGACVVECDINNRCPSGECCADGVCVETCPFGQCCATDTCVAACPNGQTCANGVCACFGSRPQACGELCCNGTDVCCPSSLFGTFCAPAGYTCCGPQTACGEQCCGDGLCAADTQLCCGSVVCPFADDVCCDHGGGFNSCCRVGGTCGSCFNCCHF